MNVPSMSRANSILQMELGEGRPTMIQKIEQNVQEEEKSPQRVAMASLEGSPYEML
jgi:putative heme iron utilization protein